MSRILEVQRYIDLIRGVRTPVALQNLVSEATREIGFDMITLFQHADISRVVSSLDHMRRGELVGISSCPLSWTEHYRDHNLIRIDPRVIAVRGTVEPFVSEDVGRFVRVTAAHRVLAEAQRKAISAKRLWCHSTSPVSHQAPPTLVCGMGVPFPIRILPWHIGLDAPPSKRLEVCCLKRVVETSEASSLA